MFYETIASVLPFPSKMGLSSSPSRLATTGAQVSPNKHMSFTATPGYFFGMQERFAEVFWDLSILHNTGIWRSPCSSSHLGICAKCLPTASRPSDVPFIFSTCSFPRTPTLKDLISRFLCLLASARCLPSLGIGGRRERPGHDSSRRPASV